MTKASQKDAVFLQYLVLEAVRGLRSRAHGLTPIEQVKLRSLLSNLAALQGITGAADGTASKDDAATTPQSVALS